MVNLDKWEKIGRSEIKEGDILKVIANGSDKQYKSRAVAHSKTGVPKGYGDSWMAGALELVVSPLADNFTEEIYRRKPKAVFTFPKSLGAVIEGQNKFYGTKKRFVRTGMGWNYDGLHYSQTQLETSYKNFVVLSEGVA
jgi:hypothetical protein